MQTDTIREGGTIAAAPRLGGEEWATLVILAGLALVPLVIEGYVLYILPQYLTFGLLAVSLSLLWGSAGIVSFGQAAFFAVGAYTFGLLTKAGSVDWINMAYVAFVLAALAGGLLAYVVGSFLFGAGVGATYFVLVTLALSIITEQLAKSRSDITGGWNGLYVDRLTLTAPGFEINMFPDVPMYYFVLVMISVVLLATMLLMRGRFGKVIVGIRENEDRMSALGYEVARYKSLIFALSGMIAAYAGSLYATHSGFVSPSLAGVLFSTEILVWVAVGGRRSLLGSFIGGVVIASLANVLSALTPEYWQLFIGLIFVTVIVLFRDGLAGVAETAARRLRGARA
jgi:urea transport system permease protein